MERGIEIRSHPQEHSQPGAGEGDRRGSHGRQGAPGEQPHGDPKSEGERCVRDWHDVAFVKRSEGVHGDPVERH
jgi:hypothetical protein